MTIETVILHGFGRGVGLQDGTARYLPTLGFGPADPAKSKGVTKSQGTAALTLLGARSKRRLKPYGPRSHHRTGSAFDEIRE